MLDKKLLKRLNFAFRKIVFKVYNSYVSLTYFFLFLQIYSREMAYIYILYFGPAVFLSVMIIIFIKFICIFILFIIFIIFTIFICIFILFYFCIYFIYYIYLSIKLLYHVCLSVCLSDHNSWTLGPIFQ